MEIKYRQRNLTMDEKIRIATDYNAGMSMEDLIKRYGVSRVTIYRALQAVAKKEGGEDDGNEKEESGSSK